MADILNLHRVRKNFAGVDEIVVNALWVAPFGSPKPGQRTRVLFRAQHLSREVSQLSDYYHVSTEYII